MLRIGKEVTQLHNKYGNGVVLKALLHKKFHSIFGNDANEKDLGIFIVAEREDYSLIKGDNSKTIEEIEMFYDTDYRK